MAISIVPVRIGSKSIPEKNIKNFCGKPLIYWTLESLQKSKNIDKLCCFGFRENKQCS